MHCLFFFILAYIRYSGTYECHVEETTQILPSQCTDSFTAVKECPSRDLPGDEELWELLSQTCCGEYPSTTLHCQSTWGDEDVMVIFPACLPRRTVSRGCFGVLGRTANGDPELKDQACNADTFQPVDRPSDDQRISVCSYPKTTCRGRGEQRLCSGGTTRDDLCIPQPYNEQCRKGDFRDGECTCVKKLCPQGTVRNMSHWYNNNVRCNDIPAELELNYSCHPRIDVPENLDPSKGGVTSSSPPPGISQSLSNTTNAVVHPSSSPDIGFRVATGVLATALVTIGPIACYVCRQRIRRYFQNVRLWMCERSRHTNESADGGAQTTSLDLSSSDI